MPAQEASASLSLSQPLLHNKNCYLQAFPLKLWEYNLMTWRIENVDLFGLLNTFALLQWMRIFAKQRLDYLLLLALLHLFLRRRQCQHTGAQIDPSRSLTSTLKLSNSKYFTDMSYFSIRYLFSSILDRYVSSIYFNIFNYLSIGTRYSSEYAMLFR